jgi:uncharacterized protein YodC (DUF2158 family)
MSGLGIGDIVRLRSGSPNLLVVDIEDGVITAAWIESVSVTMIGFECKVRNCVREIVGAAPCFKRIKRG